MAGECCQKLLTICPMHLRKVMKHSNSNGCLSSQYSITICCAEREPQIWKFVWNLRVNIGRNDMVQHINGWWMLSEALSHLPYASKEGYGITQQQWLSLHIVQYHICCAVREPQIWKFVWNLRVNIGWNGTVQHINGWYNTVRSFSHLSYASKEGYETLKQQWLSLLAVQYHICCAERVPQILKFVWNLRVNIGRNDTVQHINGWWMLSKASPICLMHLRKVMKHSSSNGCLSS